MNQRYRRQMLLRSHRHRAGKLGACGCHEPQYRARITYAWIRAFGVREWPTPRLRRVDDLPDIATFHAGMEQFRLAMTGLKPVVEQLNRNMREMVEVINAQPQGPES